MEERNSPSDQDQVKPSRFRIPKRKANSWNEEVTVTSPLSRFSSSDFQNRPKQEHQPRIWSSSYNTFNRPRNHDSEDYYRNNRSFLRQSPHRALSPHRVDHPGFVTSPAHPPLNPREQSAQSLFSPGRRGNHELKVDQKRDYQNHCKIDFNNPACDLEEAKQLKTGATKSKCETPLTEECLSFSTEKEDIQSEEPIDNCSTTSVSSKRSSEKYSCFSKNSLSSEHLQNTAHKPQEAELKEITKDYKKDLSCPSEKRLILEHSFTAKNCKVSTENRLHTLEGFSTHKLKTQEKMLIQRKCRKRIFGTYSSKNPVEPIVLSSDEENEASSDSEKAQILHLPPTQDLSSDKQDAELKHQCPLAERLASQEGENKTVEQNLMCDDQLCNSKMGAITSRRGEESRPVLEIDFRTVYFGKKKGRSKGRLKFSAATIEIPFHEALRSTVTLPVDCYYLRKCGLWKNISEFSTRSNFFIFLWLSEDYAAEIQKKLRHPLSSQPTKANQYIFLELERTLKDEEQAKLCELMGEWSTKNQQPELSQWLSWEEAAPLLEGLSKNECSFLSNCNISFRKEEGKDLKPKSQETNASISKPSFTLVRKCTVNNYAVSLIPKPDGEWKEIKAKGSSVHKLIVYPPPPTKGGLGVTQEDLECLEQGEFLNDVIIDFYLKYLSLEKVPHQLAERFHIFSSFFFKCLTRTENAIPDDSPITLAAQRRHQSVKTWTRHVDIFKKDFIFVPVNEESHWYLAVICFPHLEKAVYEERKRPTGPLQRVETEKQEDSSRRNSVIVFNDVCSRKEEMGGNSSPQSEGDDEHTSPTKSSTTKNSKGLLEKHSGKPKVCRRPCILILDSLKAGSVQNTAAVLREYLEVEWSVKRKSAREFSRSNMREFCPRVPKQDNSSDCGVYLLQYVESFFQSPIVSFEPPMHLEHWFPRHVVRSKREEIRDLILRLHLQQKSAHIS